VLADWDYNHYSSGGTDFNRYCLWFSCYNCHTAIKTPSFKTCQFSSCNNVPIPHDSRGMYYYDFRYITYPLSLTKQPTYWRGSCIDRLWVSHFNFCWESSCGNVCSNDPPIRCWRFGLDKECPVQGGEDYVFDYASEKRLWRTIIHPKHRYHAGTATATPT